MTTKLVSAQVKLAVIARLQRLAFSYPLQYALRELQGKQREIWPQLCCFHTRCVLSEPTVTDQMWGEAEAPHPPPILSSSSALGLVTQSGCPPD